MQNVFEWKTDNINKKKQVKRGYNNPKEQQQPNRSAEIHLGGQHYWWHLRHLSAAYKMMTTMTKCGRQCRHSCTTTTADCRLQSANGKSQWVNNFWTFYSAWLDSTCHLWAAFSFPFRIRSTSFSLFFPPPLPALPEAELSLEHLFGVLEPIHTHTPVGDYKLCQTRFWPAQLMTKTLLVSIFFLFMLLQRDCKSKRLEGQLGFMTACNVEKLGWLARAPVLWIAKGAGNSETGTDNCVFTCRYAEQENAATGPLRNWPRAQL